MKKRNLQVKKLEKQNIFDIEKRHKAKIIFITDNNLTISDYKLENNEDRKIVDLKSENQNKEQISKNRKNHKKSRDNNDTLNETDADLDKKKDPSLVCLLYTSDAADE